MSTSIVLPQFTESRHCRAGALPGRCRVCRSNRGFRAQMAERYTLPNNDVNFDCPHGVPWPDEKKPATKRSLIGAVGRVARGAASIAKTTLGIDLASDEQIKARLAVCAGCQSRISVKGRDRCGPMYESWLQQGGKTCGCVLEYKARDIKQDCPQNKWPK